MCKARDEPVSVWRVTSPCLPEIPNHGWQCGLEVLGRGVARPRAAMPATAWESGHGSAVQPGADDETCAATRRSSERGDALPRAPWLSLGGGGTTRQWSRVAPAAAGSRNAATLDDGGRATGYSRGRWARHWRVSAACAAAVACICALAVLLPDRGRGGGGDGGGRTFELVEQTLDAALSLRDQEDARLRGWSRAQMLALRDPAAGTAAERKAPGMGVLKQQMRHLNVLRQRLAHLAVSWRPCRVLQPLRFAVCVRCVVLRADRSSRCVAQLRAAPGHCRSLAQRGNRQRRGAASRVWQAGARSPQHSQQRRTAGHRQRISSPRCSGT